MTLRLPRLAANFAIADASGKPLPAFIQWWQSMAQRIETSINGLEAAQAAAVAATAAAAVANAAAVAADASASAATSAAATVTADSSLANSYVTGLTMTATDAGADATVTISAHTRVYGDGSSVAVTGGTVTGLPYSTVERIYYDQASRAGGAVTYLATTSATTAAQVGDRHSVGAVTTPAAAAGPTTGNGVYPPGYAIP